MRLRLQGLSKGYRRAGKTVEALREFDLELADGQLCGLLGPNGAGKTTLLRLVSGLCTPDAGRLLWQGRALGRAELGRIGLLLEGRGSLNERLSTWENARYYCGLREARFEADHVRALAAQLELPDLHSPVRLLSTGNKLRAALLLTLVHRPALVLLDEPSLGLDLFGVDRLRALLRAQREAGAAVLVSSHDLDLVESLAERVVCISGGRKCFDGARADFVPRGGAYRLRLQDPEGLAGELLGQASPLPDGQWELRLPDHQALCQLMQRLTPLLPRLRGLELQPQTLAARYRELLEAAA